MPLSLYKVQAGLVLNVDATTWPGPLGTLFYDGDDGVLRIGDGVTPGGRFVYTTLGGNVSGNLLPSIVGTGTGLLSTATIGSLTNPWATLYLSSTTFYLGGLPISVFPNGSITVNGVQVGTGYTGSRGTGFTGSQGIVGFTGSAGSGGGTNLVFTTTGTTSTLTGYVDPTGTVYPVRKAEITSGAFVLNLAAFTPTLASSVQPSSTLNWDVVCTGFTVTVTNPTDFTSEYISGIRSIFPISGSVTTNTSLYTSLGPTVTPAGGVSWLQTFTNNASAFIRPISSTITGGSASAIIGFNKKTTGLTTATAYLDSSSTWSVSWNTPTLTIAMTDLTGNNFLQSYSQTAYSIAVTGITNAGNYSLSVTSVGGTVSNILGSGTITFTNAIHKNNQATARSVTVVGTFNRPSAVTGSAYSTSLTASDTSVVTSFSYPSFWVFTPATNQPPTTSTVVLGTAFASGVTALGDQIKTFTGTVNNSGNVPKVFWLGVRASASQPTAFKTGASASLLSDVTITSGSVSLTPSPTPAGYTAENYSLYGIILQPGNTYVSIS